MGRSPYHPRRNAIRGNDDRSAVPIDDGLVRTAFLDLVGRPPFDAERSRWIGRPLGELVDGLVGSPEFWEQWLEAQLYYFLLIENFEPASASIRELPEALHEGRLGVRDALHRIALCPSFDRRNPGADTFVTVVMEQFLGIEVQRSPRELEIGKRVYDGHTGSFLGSTGSSQADVVRIAVEDERFLVRFVEREFERLLFASAERRTATAWARELERDPYSYPTLVRSWLLSDAYATRTEVSAPVPNHLFVRSLFVDLLDRLPDREETRRLRGALDGLGDAGPLRSALVRILLDSDRVELAFPEAAAGRRDWVDGLFRRLLGRAATEGELEAFTEALEDPACRPETVLFAILSHPDYSRY